MGGCVLEKILAPKTHMWIVRSCHTFTSINFESRSVLFPYMKWLKRRPCILLNGKQDFLWALNTLLWVNGVSHTAAYKPWSWFSPQMPFGSYNRKFNRMVLRPLNLKFSEGEWCWSIIVILILSTENDKENNFTQSYGNENYLDWPATEYFLEWLKL